MTDGALVQAHLAGDPAAFPAIYDRYADRIYTYCASMLRHRDDATDAAQDTFVTAAAKLDQLRDPDRLRPWLFSIARNASTNRLRRRQREQPEDAFEDLMAADADPGRRLDAADAAALVWDAAGSLQPRDRELLELHVRNGLEGADLAEAMGVSTGHVATMLHRANERIATAIGSMLVARHGREACASLDRLLVDWDGRFSLDVRAKVTRHIGSCEICSRARDEATSPARLAAALPLLAAPVGLREAVLGAIGGAGAAAGTASAGAGSALTTAGATGGLAVKVGAVLAAVVVVGGGIGYAVMSGDDAPTEDVAAGSAPAPGSATTVVAVSSTTPAPTTPAPTSSTTVSSVSTTSSSVPSGPSSTAPPAPEPGLAAAQAAWAVEAGRSYFLVMDIDSEGLFGTYCVIGVAGDASQTADVAGTGAAGPQCEVDGQPFFGDPVDVETLLAWAAQAVDAGGSVEFNDAGVPVDIELPASGEGEATTVTVVAFDFNGP